MKFMIPSLLLTLALIVALTQKGRDQSIFPQAEDKPLNFSKDLVKLGLILLIIGTILALLLMPDHLNFQ